MKKAEKQVSLRVPIDRYDELKAISDHYNVSQGKIVSALIRSFWKFGQGEIKASEVPMWIYELLGLDYEKGGFLEN